MSQTTVESDTRQGLSPISNSTDATPIQNPLNPEIIEAIEASYEENVGLTNQVSVLFKNLCNNSGSAHARSRASIPGDLYKVTEYNESLECSVSDEGSDLMSKLNDFSFKITSSMADKFPKFSIASLSISDTSYQNAYELYKKSYLDYVEPLEIVNYSTHERTELEPFNKHPTESPMGGTTNALSFSDSNTNKGTLENKKENCACPTCGIF